MKETSKWIGVAWLVLLAFALIVALFWAIIHRERDMNAALALARRDYPDVPRIQVRDLQEWLADKSRPQPQLFDVRTPEEYAVSCLPGARRIEPNTRVKEVRAVMDTNQPAVFYCSIGYRSSAVVSALQHAGFTNMVNLEGSIFAWALAGLPLEQPDTKQPTRLVHPFSVSYAKLLPHDMAANVPLLQSARHEIAARQRMRMALSIGLLAMFLVWESFSPMYPWFKGRGAARLEHGFRNIVLGLLNTVVVAVLFVQAWLWAANWAQDHRVGLLNLLHLPGWLRAPIALLLLDGWMYAWHRLNHGIVFLWRFHRVHHAERYLDVTSATRFHLGEIALSALIRVPLIFIFGIHFSELVLYESLLFAVVQFHHANIRLPAHFEKMVSRILVTPNIHRVHHSRLRRETDSNFASLLSFWDRAFHTRRHTDLENIQLGLDEFSPQDDTLAGIMETPLRSTARGPASAPKTSSAGKR
jgi:sterol desaturase/sphingolipid hydroxylase (fatty acid hydroxylase superfamily)/rhodanese-related sulfurtransferase